MKEEFLNINLSYNMRIFNFSRLIDKVQFLLLLDQGFQSFCDRGTLNANKKNLRTPTFSKLANNTLPFTWPILTKPTVTKTKQKILNQKEPLQKAPEQKKPSLTKIRYLPNLPKLTFRYFFEELTGYPEPRLKNTVLDCHKA